MPRPDDVNRALRCARCRGFAALGYRFCDYCIVEVHREMRESGYLTDPNIQTIYDERIPFTKRQACET